MPTLSQSDALQRRFPLLPSDPEFTDPFTMLRPQDLAHTAITEDPAPFDMDDTHERPQGAILKFSCRGDRTCRPPDNWAQARRSPDTGRLARDEVTRGFFFKSFSTLGRPTSFANSSYVGCASYVACSANRLCHRHSVPTLTPNWALTSAADTGVLVNSCTA